jgi:hypothetical protein
MISAFFLVPGWKLYLFFYTEMKCNTQAFSQIQCRSIFLAMLSFCLPLCAYQHPHSPRCLCRTASDRYCYIIIYRYNVRLIQIAMVPIGRLPGEVRRQRPVWLADLVVGPGRVGAKWPPQPCSIHTSNLNFGVEPAALMQAWKLKRHLFLDFILYLLINKLILFLCS